MNDGQGRFGGDMDRNEVEMDLNKFMAMIQEISALKDKIRDLEAPDKINPHQKWIHLAKAVDSWRIFPRMFLTVYIILLYKFIIQRIYKGNTNETKRNIQEFLGCYKGNT